MFWLNKKKIGIIGYGNMGSAIAARIKRKYSVIVFDKERDKTKNIAGIETAENALDLIKKADIVILAVKPQDFDSLLGEIKEAIKDKLLISIAAGISIDYIERNLGRIRAIRVMPNIGAITGKSVSYICKGNFALEKDLRLSTKLFNLIGHTFWLLSEDLMDAATAVAGSGPGFWGYLFDKQPMDKWDEYKSNYFIPELTAAAVNVGFDEKTAKSTASLVTASSISIVNALHIRPIELAGRVASKGGTTEAGLEVLKNGGSLTDAIKAATKRAGELSKKEK